MSVTITITKADVRDEVSRTTAYEGAHGGAFDNTFAKKEDAEMLERYWKEGTSILTDVWKKYIEDTNHNDDKYEVVLTMPGNFDDNMIGMMEDSAFAYLCNYIVGKWMEMISSDKSALYITTASQSLLELKRAMLHRKSPIRPTD